MTNSTNGAINLFSQHFLPNNPVTRVVVERDRLEKLHQDSIQLALEGKYDGALSKAHELPEDSLARATTLFMLSDIASSAPTPNFYFSERAAEQISDLHSQEKTMAFFRLAWNLKNKYKSEWKEVAEKIQNPQLKALILPPTQPSVPKTPSTPQKKTKSALHHYLIQKRKAPASVSNFQRRMRQETNHSKLPPIETMYDGQKSDLNNSSNESLIPSPVEATMTAKPLGKLMRRPTLAALHMDDAELPKEP
jgi:hypothetical protein